MTNTLRFGDFGGVGLFRKNDILFSERTKNYHMIGAKYHKMLLNLGEDDRKQYQMWLRRRCATDKPELQALHHEYLRALPEGPDEYALWDQIFPGKAYHYDKLKRLPNYLVAHLSEFLTEKAMREDCHSLKLFQIRGLSYLNDPEIFYREVEKFFKEQEKIPLFLPDDLQLRHEISLDYQRILSLHEPRAKNNRFAEVLDSGEAWMIVEELSHLCMERHLHGRSKREPYLAGEAYFITRARRYEGETQYELISLMAAVLGLLRGDAEHPSRSVLAQFDRLRPGLDRERANNLDVLICSVLTREFNASQDNDTAKLVIDIYLRGLEDGSWMVHGELSPQILKNLVSAGVKTWQLDEAEEWLRTWLPRVPDSGRAHTRDHCLGVLAFARRDWDRALQLLNMSRFANEIEAFNCRSLLLCIYYHKHGDEPQFLVSKAKAFEKYIRIQDMASENDKRPFLNFIKFYLRLVDARDAAALAKLECAVRESQPLNKRWWLLENIALKLSLI